MEGGFCLSKFTELWRYDIFQIMKNVEIKKSKNGLGIFAKTKFKTKENIFEVKGEFISCDEENDIDEKTRDNSFRYDEEKYLSPAGELGDFLNHSCDPNSAVVKKGDKLFIVAVRDINPGDEVVIDYSTILASDDSWEMGCHCGLEICRKVIKKFDSLPIQIRQKYIASNMVPKYILN